MRVFHNNLVNYLVKDPAGIEGSILETHPPESPESDLERSAERTGREFVGAKVCNVQTWGSEAISDETLTDVNTFQAPDNAQTPVPRLRSSWRRSTHGPKEPPPRRRDPAMTSLEMVVSRSRCGERRRAQPDRGFPMGRQRAAARGRRCRSAANATPRGFGLGGGHRYEDRFFIHVSLASPAKNVQLDRLANAMILNLHLSPYSRRPALVLAAAHLAASLVAGEIHVPNGSFEQPSTPFADPRIDGWQKSPKPFWFDESRGTWDQLTGVFLNTAADKPDHIANLHQTQAAFFFAVPEVALSQEAGSGGSQAFQAQFEPGRSYTLTAAVLGNGGGMSNGVTLELSFFYRDADSNAVKVAATTITNSAERFPSRDRFTDFQVKTPSVRGSDPWAGKPIGIRILSTVAPELAGGYWDLDHVRLHEDIELPNASFESPSTPFADPRVDAWQKSPKPFWFDESRGTWDQLTGVFLNTPPDKPDHIINMDGSQALFFFAVPEVALSQDAAENLDSAFSARYRPGYTYQLFVDVLGNGGGMSNGVTVDLVLRTRNTDGNPVPLATAGLSSSEAAFPSRTRFSPYATEPISVRASDAAAGRPVGVQILSTVRPDLAGGYWDFDHVRIVETRTPTFEVPRLTDAGFELRLVSEPGLSFQILASSNPALPLSAWSPIATLSNPTGTVAFSDPTAGGPGRFYMARQLLPPLAVSAP